jgi:hypothetical protein
MKKSYGLQEHSPRGTPLCVFSPLSEVMRLMPVELELVPLLFIDRQATLLPKVQGNVE